LLRLAAHRIDIGAMPISIRISGIDCYRLRIISNRFLVLLQISIGKGASLVRSSIIRLCFENYFVICDRLFPFAFRDKGKATKAPGPNRSEEHTSELQSQSNLVCRLLLEKKK